MPDFTNIKDHRIDRPDTWTCLGSPEDFDALSDEFKDQIIFQNEEASDFLYKYFESSKFHTGPLWKPFEKVNFKYTEKIRVGEDTSKIKKWLYKRGIPFARWVYVLPNFSNNALTMTWKMVNKNCENLFFADDVVIFDKTHQWCLTYFHEDEMFFGKINTPDPEKGYKEVEKMNEKEKKYPGYKHPLR